MCMHPSSIHVLLWQPQRNVANVAHQLGSKGIINVIVHHHFCSKIHVLNNMDIAIYSWYIANSHLRPPHLFFNFNELIILFGVAPKHTQPPFVSLYGYLPLVYHKFCYNVLSIPYNRLEYHNSWKWWERPSSTTKTFLRRSGKNLDLRFSTMNRDWGSRTEHNNSVFLG